VAHVPRKEEGPRSTPRGPPSPTTELTFTSLKMANSKSRAMDISVCTPTTPKAQLEALRLAWGQRTSLAVGWTLSKRRQMQLLATCTVSLLDGS
jgi:hypothetical protein